MKLDPLPSSDSKYWENADINRHILKEEPKCDHSFKRTKSNEVVCGCGVGYFISPGDELKDGHIYRHGSLMI